MRAEPDFMRWFSEPRCFLLQHLQTLELSGFLALSPKNNRGRVRTLFTAASEVSCRQYPDSSGGEPPSAALTNLGQSSWVKLEM